MRSFLLNAHLALGATILGGALAGGAALAAGDHDWTQGSDTARPAPQARAMARAVQTTEVSDDVAITKDSGRQD